MDQDKAKIQEQLYSFPYHYIPHFDKNGIPYRNRSLSWGFEYLCYIKHAKDVVESLNPNSLLDVGCGSGRFIGLLNDNRVRKVGVDLSERAIAFAKAFNNQGINIQFRAIDASYVDETFDVVTAIEVLEHIPDEGVSHFIQTLEDKTNLGGHVLISVPTNNYPLNKKHYRHYNLKLLEEQVYLFTNKLEVVKVEYIYRNNFVSKTYEKLTRNRFWYFESPILNKYYWNYLWKSLRIATENNGKHLMVLFRKS